MPLKANQSVINSFLFSVRKETLKHMIKKQEEKNIQKGYQDRANYYALNMDNASKGKLVRYYMLIKTRRCVRDEIRSFIDRG